jgi:hypothetical protein
MPEGDLIDSQCAASNACGFFFAWCQIFVAAAQLRSQLILQRLFCNNNLRGE